jgi:hypothetical protein
MMNKNNKMALIVGYRHPVLSGIAKSRAKIAIVLKLPKNEVKEDREVKEVNH